MDAPIPTIIDTDIGTDVDDALAILTALACPELNIVGITTVYVDTMLRTSIAQRLLQLAGRSDIPVRTGEATPLGAAKGREAGFWEWHEGRGILYESMTEEEKDFQKGVLDNTRNYVDLPSESKPAVDFLWDTALQHGNLHIISIGPQTNIAIAIQRFDQFASLIGGITVMGGYFERNGPVSRTDHNFASDAQAVKVVLESGIPLTILGGEITQYAHLEREKLDVLHELNSPLAEVVLRLVDIYLKKKGRTYTYLHDPLAVAIQAQPNLAHIASRRVYYDPETGLISFKPFQGSKVSAIVNVVEDIQMKKFHNFFYESLYKVCSQDVESHC